MAFMRSIVTRSNLVRRSYHPSVGYFLRKDDQKNSYNDDVDNGLLNGLSNVLQQRSFGDGSISNSSAFGFYGRGRCTDFFPLSGSVGLSFCRHMSATKGGGLEKTEIMSDYTDDKIEIMSDAADVLSGAVQTVVDQAAGVSEVAVAAADSFFPIAALQYFIDAVHTYTGLNWWSSIVLVTLLIRTAMIPVSINILKSTAKLSLLRPKLEEIQQQVKETGMDPMAVAEGQQKMQKLFKEHGVSPFSAMKGIFVQGPIFISFFLAITNMAEKMSSFKEGGAYWFVDLTSPDTLYIFPVLTGLTFWITVESNMQEGLEGNPISGTMKKISRVFAILSVPLTMSFPKAIFCYWITSNIFGLMYGLALKAPGVKKALGVPEIPVAPQKGTTQPSFNLLSALKEVREAKSAREASVLSSPVQSSSDQRVASSTIISQRIKNLERQVKGRKKNKKR